MKNTMLHSRLPSYDPTIHGVKGAPYFVAGADELGSLPNIEPNFGDARLIVLLDGHGPKHGLLKVSNSDVKIWTKQLNDSGYPPIVSE